MLGSALKPTSRAVSRIQRLCCSGLGQAAIPEVLRELTTYIPSHGPTFFCFSPDYKPDVYTEQSEVAELIPLYFDEFFNRREREVLRTFPEVLQIYYLSPVGYYFERRVKVGHNEFFKSDYYNMLMAPLKWERNLAVGVVGSGRPLATIQIPRSANEPDFRKRDIRLLEVVTPFIAHLLTDRREESGYTESENKGLVIADEEGRIQHASPGARRLLLTVRFASSPPKVTFGVSNSALPDEVVRICRNIAVWSDYRPLPAPPVWRCRNEWGEFVFRVFRLDREASSSSSRLIGVSVELYQPLRLRLLRRIGELPLTNREIECCVALVERLTRAEIAERLGVSEMTAITHCRNLYGKLNVHGRAGLVEKLRAL